MALVGSGRVFIASTPNFGPTMTTDPVPAGFTEKRPFLHFAEKRKTGRKSVFFEKKLQKFAKRLIFIGEKATFSFPQLFPVVARTWLESKSECFLVEIRSWRDRNLKFGPNCDLEVDSLE